MYVAKKSITAQTNDGSLDHLSPKLYC